MRFLEKHMPDKNQPPLSGKQALASFMHIMTMAVGVLLLLILGISCIAGFGAANQAVNKYEYQTIEDAQKFENGGGFLYFLYYLRTSEFPETFFLFVLIFVEFMLYVTQSRSITIKQPIAGGIWIFAIILTIHATVFIHSRLIPEPQMSLDDWSILHDMRLYYRSTAEITIGPAILHFFSYLCRLRAYRSNKQGDKGTVLLSPCLRDQAFEYDGYG